MAAIPDIGSACGDTEPPDSQVALLMREHHPFERRHP